MPQHGPRCIAEAGSQISVQCKTCHARPVPDITVIIYTPFRCDSMHVSWRKSWFDQRMAAIDASVEEANCRGITTRPRCPFGKVIDKLIDHLSELISENRGCVCGSPDFRDTTSRE